MANQTKENVELTESSIFSIDMKENWYDSPKMRQLIMRTYAPSASPEEFMLFTQVCKERHLSPVDNEISFQKRWSRRKEKQKDGSFKDVWDEKVLFVTHRDGYLKIAKQDPSFEGLNAQVIYENDDFEVRTDENGSVIINHKFGLKNRGEIVGAWAIAKRKGYDPVVEVVPFNEYYDANVGNNVNWDKYKHSMIQKVAESHALRKQCCINGLTSEETVSSIGELENIKTSQQFNEIKKLVDPSHIGNIINLEDVDNYTLTDIDDSLIEESKREEDKEKKDKTPSERAIDKSTELHNLHQSQVQAIIKTKGISEKGLRDVIDLEYSLYKSKNKDATILSLKDFADKYVKEKASEIEKEKSSNSNKTNQSENEALKALSIDAKEKTITKPKSTLL